MRVTVRVNDVEHEAAPPFAGADHVIAEGAACPDCGAAPLKIRGRGIEMRGHDFEEAPAFCLCCGSDAGRVRVTYSTIFGIEEDRAVLSGRPRVY